MKFINCNKCIIFIISVCLYYKLCFACLSLILLVTPTPTISIALVALVMFSESEKSLKLSIILHHVSLFSRRISSYDFGLYCPAIRLQYPRIIKFLILLLRIKVKLWLHWMMTQRICITFVKLQLYISQELVIVGKEYQLIIFQLLWYTYCLPRRQYYQLCSY